MAQQNSTDPHELDVIDFTAYLDGKDPGDLPARVLASLQSTSCLAVKDPRVTNQQNEDFLNLMESYFALPREQKMKDARPEQSYQVCSAESLSTAVVWNKAQLPASSTPL